MQKPRRARGHRSQAPPLRSSKGNVPVGFTAQSLGDSACTSGFCTARKAKSFSAGELDEARPPPHRSRLGIHEQHAVGLGLLQRGENTGPETLKRGHIREGGGDFRRQRRPQRPKRTVRKRGADAVDGAGATAAGSPAAGGCRRDNLFRRGQTLVCPPATADGLSHAAGDPAGAEGATKVAPEGLAPAGATAARFAPAGATAARGGCRERREQPLPTLTAAGQRRTQAQEQPPARLRTRAPRQPRQRRRPAGAPGFPRARPELPTSSASGRTMRVSAISGKPRVRGRLQLAGYIPKTQKPRQAVDARRQLLDQLARRLGHVEYHPGPATAITYMLRI